MRLTDRRPASRLAGYPTLASFYSADRRRIDSREVDVGLWWREDAAGPMHRAAWVQDTGELYLVRLGPVAGGGGAVELLANVADEEQLERLLGDWRERCGAPRSLTWLRERARAIRARSRQPSLRAGTGTVRAQPAMAAR
jgi:hypothetical protein